MNDNIEHDIESPNIDAVSKPVEDDTARVRTITVATLVACVLLAAISVGLKEFFSLEVIRVEYEQRLSVPDSRLQQQKARDAQILAGEEDPLTGSKGIPIDTTIEIVGDNPELIAPIESTAKKRSAK